jgi:hypothetical protein
MKSSKNVALNTAIQMAGVMRRRCVEAYNKATTSAGVGTLRTIMNTLRAPLNTGSGSPEHVFLSDYAFFGSDEILGKRRGFARQFGWLVRQDLLALREAVMHSPFGLWECVEDSDAQAGFLWRAVGPVEDGASAEKRVFAVTDQAGDPVAAKVGQMRAGWMVDLGGVRLGGTSRANSAVEGMALLFSRPLAKKAAARMKKAAAERRWHAESDAEPPQFMRPDYERDVLTQAVRPDCKQCGLDEYYFLPVRIRQVFPQRFADEMMRRLGDRYGTAERVWHVELACAVDETGRRNLFAWFDERRLEAEKKVNYYSSDRVELGDLRRLVSDAALLRLMGAGPEAEVDLGDFSPLESHRVALLDLEPDWLDQAGINENLPISRARKALESQSQETRDAFEQSVVRHLIRLRWVALLKDRLALVEGLDSYDEPTFDFPEYNRLRDVLDELFLPVLGDRPLSDALRSMKGRATTLEKALLEDLALVNPAEWGDPDKLRPLTLADLPMRVAHLKTLPGIGPATIEKIEDCLLGEFLAWPRALDPPAAADPHAETRLADGLDELGDLFD